MRKQSLLAGLSAVALTASAFVLPAFAVPPNYTLFGEASNVNNYIQTVSDASPAFGGISFQVSGITYAQLTHLSTDYNVTDDDCGGGSPRFAVRIDKTGDNVSDGQVVIHVGPSPSFTDCPPGWQNTGNLIGNNDAGRYDYSQFGGSQFTTYNNAPAGVMTGAVVGINLLIDSGWSAAASNGDGEQTVLFDNTQINNDVVTFSQPGDLIVHKYSCPSSATPTRAANAPNASGAIVVPAGCVPEQGVNFGSIHQADKTDYSAPYTGLGDGAPYTSMGTTDANGVVTQQDVPAAGRYNVAELSATGSWLSSPPLLGFYCAGTDTGDGTNNYEIAFVPAGGETHCVAYNMAKPASPLFWVEEDTTQVKIDWKAVPGATAYRVYHATGSMVFTPIFTGAVLTFTHTVPVNTDHYYRVTAYNAAGESNTTVPAKYAGTKTVVIDDNSMAPDFNASGTSTPIGAWSSFDVNTAGAEQILSFATGGDNYAVAGAFGNQSFEWVTSSVLSGHYNVYVNYICDTSRGTANYNVYSGGTQLNGAPVAVDQALKSSDNTACGSQSDPAAQPFWKLLGNYAFSGTGKVTLVSATGNNILADAVAFQSTAAFQCTNGVLEPGEACDDGNQVNTDGCTNTCELPFCGNGIVQQGEQCDDGNQVNNDACSNTCQLPAPQAPTCNGLTATIYVKNGKIVGGPNNGQNYNGTLNGGNGNDVMVGTAGPDTIRGRDGNDTICGLEGADNLQGADGTDWIDGDGGADTITGGDFNDTLLGGAGNDKIKGQDGSDVMCGAGGNDTIEGGDAGDKLDGGPLAGNDTLKGQSGQDICRRGDSNSTCEQTSNVALPECQ